MQLLEIAEANLNEYIDKTLADDPEYIDIKRKGTAKKKFLDVLCKCLRKSQSVSTYIEQAIVAVQNMKIEEAYAYCHKAAKGLDRLSLQMDTLPAQFGEQTRTQGTSVMATSRDATFEYLEGDILHITLPELLPKRLKYNASTGEYENTFGQELFKSRYQKSFYKEYQNGKHKVHSNKVFLFTVNYYKTGDSIYDHDNLDGKAFQDMIAAMVLFDDGPEECAVIYDSKVGEYTHTEAFIIPEKMLVKFLGYWYNQ